MELSRRRAIARTRHYFYVGVSHRRPLMRDTQEPYEIGKQQARSKRGVQVVHMCGPTKQRGGSVLCTCLALVVLLTLLSCGHNFCRLTIYRQCTESFVPVPSYDRGGVGGVPLHRSHSLEWLQYTLPRVALNVLFNNRFLTTKKETHVFRPCLLQATIVQTPNGTSPPNRHDQTKVVIYGTLYTNE